MPEFRVAVGIPNGRRSTIWKFVTQGDEAYIFSRMFGSQVKVSLHASGECQWSAPSEWVKAAPGRRNADRHFKKWQALRPDSGSALHVFQIRIPTSELREVSDESDLDDVRWLSPPQGISTTLTIECFITSVLTSAPSPNAVPGRTRLFSLQLTSGRWLVGFTNSEYVAPESIEEIRQHCWRDAQAAGIELSPEMRGAAFVEYPTSLRGLIEIAPPNAV